MNELWTHQTKDEAIDEATLMLYILRNGINGLSVKPRLEKEDVNTTYIKVKGVSPESARFVLDQAIDILNAFKDGGKNNG